MVPELPGELWTLVLDAITLDGYDACGARSRPTGIHLRRVRASFSSHSGLRSLAYLFAPPNEFVGSLRLTDRFVTRASLLQEAFKLSQVITRRAAVSRRCGTSKLSMDLLYASVLRHVEEVMGNVPSSRRMDFVDFLVYCFSPLAGYMRVYKKNSLLTTVRVPEFTGISELRENLTAIVYRAAGGGASSVLLSNGGGASSSACSGGGASSSSSSPSSAR